SAFGGIGGGFGTEAGPRGFRYRDAQRFSGSYWGASPSSRNYNNAGTEGITEAQETAQGTKPGPRTAVNPNKEAISVAAGDTVEHKNFGTGGVTERQGKAQQDVATVQRAESEQ